MRTSRPARPALGAALSVLALALFSPDSTAWARKESTTSWTAGAHHRAHPSAASGRIIKVSLANRVIYVMEGSRPLLVAPTCSGKPGHATPVGEFHVTGKAKRRRSGKYGFWVKEGQAVEGTKTGGPPDKKAGWKYVGYPMPFWIGFRPGYGFHEGYLWSIPRTHGCLHLNGRDAERLYELAPCGTRISIAKTQPEDQTLGKDVHHPEDEKAPDPPFSFFLSDKSFTIPWENVLKSESAKPAQNLGAGEADATTRKGQAPDKSQENGSARPAAPPSRAPAA